MQLREMRTADDYRAMWDTIERLWTDTIARAGRLPNLLSACGSTTSGPSSRPCAISYSPPTSGRPRDPWRAEPYHPLGLPQPGYPSADAAALGIDIVASPSLAEVMEVRRNRMALVRGSSTGSPTPAWNGYARGCPRRLPGGNTLGWSLPARCHEGGVRAPPLHGTRPDMLETDLDGRAAHHDAPP